MEICYGFRVNFQDGSSLTERDFASEGEQFLRETDKVLSYAYQYQNPQLLLTLYLDIFRQEGAVEWSISLENRGEVLLELASVNLAEGQLISTHSKVVYVPWKALNIGLQSTDVHVGIESLLPDRSHYFDSFTALHQPSSKRNILFGCCSFHSYFPHVLVQAKKNNENLDICLVNMLDQLLLPAGSSITTEKAVLIIGDQDHDQLFRLYMDRVCHEMHPASKFRKPPTGWLSWYYYYGTVTEQDILENVRNLEQFPDIHPEYIVIDAGWFLETGFGDWEANSKFPHGMKWLADQITASGYKPGLWFSPLLADAGSALVQQHPNWLLRKNGLPVAGMNPNGSDVLELHEKNNIKFVLDLTHPEVLEYLHFLFHRAIHDWGFRYIKLDFLVRSLFTDQGNHSSLGREQILYPGTTTAKAYRNAMSVIREAAGKDCYILGCAAPLFSSIGDIIDANRMTPDITRRNYTVNAARPTAWELVKICSKTMAARYFLNGTAGFSDPDVLVVRGHEPEGISDDYKPTLDEARVWAGIVALSGGLLFYNDNLTVLEEERKPIVNQLFPVGPGAAIPLDYFNTDAPEIWKLAISRDGDRQMIIGLFNWGETAKDMTVTLDELGFDRNEKVHGIELWSQAYVSGQGELQVLQVLPHSMRLLSLCSDVSQPHLIGTDMHFSQGWAEFERITWANQTLTLSWKPSYTKRGNIHIYIPAAFLQASIDTNAEVLGQSGSVMTVSQKDILGDLWIKFHIA